MEMQFVFLWVGSDAVGLNLGHPMLILRADDFNRSCAVLF